MTRYVCYFRVSTDRQGQSGLGLEAQETAVNAFVRDAEIVGRFVEVESGRNNERPKLAEALRLAKRTKSVLVIAKLDRLARSVAFISGLMESGVEFVACDMPSANKLTIHIMAAMAEHEADMISKRTRDALQALKERGVKLGSPKLDETRKLGVEAQKAKAANRAANVLPVIESIRAAGVTTLVGIAGALNARGIVTPRGGEWHATSVQRVLARAA